ncbi:MAG: diacylglycerol kinase family protein [Candidatus Tectimicrobiota bacterium]
MNYLLVLNPKAKRYSPGLEGHLLEQARAMLGPSVRLAWTVPGEDGRYSIAGAPQVLQTVDCVIAVGGDGTVNIVVSALARHGVLSQVSLGVMPYGTGNNLVRSFGLERDSHKALQTIRQGHTTRLDIGVVNEHYYCVNVSIGLFAHLMAHRVTNSLLGYTYEAVRHLGFRPWPIRIGYTDATGRRILLPCQDYIVGAMLNTSHYGSILHMAPDAVSDDGLFDVKLIRATPRLLYPLVFTIILTGQYDLSRHTMTFRASQLELSPEVPCGCEMDGESVPIQPRYCVRMAGSVRLLVPAASLAALRAPAP